MDRRDSKSDEPPEKINRAFVIEENWQPPAKSNVCFEFQRNGRCSKDNCRFEHRREGESAGAGQEKRFSAFKGATIKRGEDGSIELIQEEPQKEPEEQYYQEQGKESKKNKRKRDEKEDKKKSKSKKKKSKKEKKEKKKKEKDSKKKKKKKRRKSSSSSSSSSSSDSSDEDSGVERERLEEMQRKAEEAARDEQPPEPEYEVERIGSDDYFNKNHEFSAWLKKTKGKYFTEMMSEEARSEFEVFKEEWNAGRLPMRLYKGVTVQGRR